MDSGFTIGSVRGIEIRASWSVLVVVALVTWSLADGLLPEFADGYRSEEYWGMAVVLAIAFLVGLVAHELGHSLVAANEGVEVVSITLWLFGGVAQLASSPSSPRCAMRIAAAGPAVSALLGIIALALAAAADGLLAAGIAWYGAVNLLLAFFNLLPAFPMDGGRIYQAWLWARSGDELDATRRAAAVGRTIGAGLVVLGILETVITGAIGGIWLVLIGWFVREAARAETDRATFEGPLRDIPVANVMTADPERVAGDTSVEDFVTEVLFGGRHAAYPVVRNDGSIMGLITLNAVRARDRDTWVSTEVAELADPVDRLIVTDPAASMANLVEAMSAGGERRALVLDGDRLVGIVSPSDVARLVVALELAGRPSQ